MENFNPDPVSDNQLQLQGIPVDLTHSLESFNDGSSESWIAEETHYASFRDEHEDVRTLRVPGSNFKNHI